MRIAAELRYAARRLARRPGLTALAVGLIAVGLSGNLALLGALDAILYRQAPITEPDRLVRVVRTDDERSTEDNWAYPTAQDLARDARSLAGAAAFADWRSFHIQPAGGESREVRGSVVAGGYFDLLGARAALGRLLEPGDEAARSAVVVLSHELWRTAFARDPRIVGSTTRINGKPFTVVGVAPRGLGSLDPAMNPQFWVPARTWSALLEGGPPGRDLAEERGSSWLDLLARLAPGATVEAVQAELDARLARLAEEFPDTLLDATAAGPRPARAWVVPLEIARVGGPAQQARVGRQTRLVAALGALVLLAIAANVAALLAARATQARHESAVRVALGASRPALVAPLVLEGLLLVGAGAALAVPLAAAGARLARAALGFVLPLAELDSIPLFDSPRLLAVGGSLTLLALVVVAAAPGVVAARVDPLPALRRAAPGLGGARRVGAADALLVAQVSLSVLLLAVAGLLVGRFRELSQRELGLELEGVVQAAYSLQLQGYAPDRAAAFHDELLRRAGAALGEERVALTSWSPMRGGWSRNQIHVEGVTSEGGPPTIADVAVATPALARVLGLRLLRGRFLAPTDRAGAPRVAVVNRTLAERYFGGRDPIGMRLGRGARDPEPLTVVGVVADAQFRSRGAAPEPMYFRALDQMDGPPMSMTLVAVGERPAAALATIRALAGELDPELPLVRVEPLAEQADRSMAAERRAAALFSGLAALVLVLATAGLGALALVAVARRRREIGIRVALGAGPAGVVALLLHRIAVLIAVGGALGCAIAALVLPRVGELAGASAHLDAQVALAALALLAAAAALATWLPARRALSIDPAEALRAE